MHLKHALRLPAIFAVLLILTAGCTRQPITDVSQEAASPVNADGFKVINGTLSFASSATFKQTMERLHSMEEADVRAMVKAIPGFKSLACVQPSDIKPVGGANFRSAQDEDDDSSDPGEDLFYDDSVVADPYLVALLNQKREIMFDSLVFRVTGKGVFAYWAGKSTDFETIYATPEFDQAISGKYIDEEYKTEDDIEQVAPDVFLVYRQDPSLEFGRTGQASACSPGGTLGQNAFGQIFDCDESITNRKRI